MSRKPGRLGMGLSALLGEPQEEVADAAPRSLPVEALEPGPFQPRGPMDAEAMAELAASIREHGVLQPLLVRPKPGEPGIWQIIGGERRWRAAQAAGLHEVPALSRDLSDREAMAAGLVENLQREDLNALEEAEGYGRLVEQFGSRRAGRAVQRSADDAQTGGDRRVRVGTHRARHPHGERAGGQFVVGEQHQRA